MLEGASCASSTLSPARRWPQENGPSSPSRRLQSPGRRPFPAATQAPVAPRGATRSCPGPVPVQGCCRAGSTTRRCCDSSDPGLNVMTHFAAVPEAQRRDTRSLAPLSFQSAASLARSIIWPKLRSGPPRSQRTQANAPSILAQTAHSPIAAVADDQGRAAEAPSRSSEPRLDFSRPLVRPDRARAPDSPGDSAEFVAVIRRVDPNMVSSSLAPRQMREGWSHASNPPSRSLLSSSRVPLTGSARRTRHR